MKANIKNASMLHLNSRSIRSSNHDENLSLNSSMTTDKFMAKSKTTLTRFEDSKKKGFNLTPGCNLKLEQSYHLSSDEVEQVIGLRHAFFRIVQPMPHLHQSMIQI